MLASGYHRRPAPTLDVARCSVRLTAPSGQRRSASAVISGAAVAVGQTAGRSVTTMLTVKSRRCARSARTAGAAAPAQGLRVNTRGQRGRWRVRGNYSIGGSVGTDWTTIEGCSSTTTVVHRGRVRVFDRIKSRTVIVRAGDRYVAERTSPALRSARLQRDVGRHLTLDPWPAPRFFPSPAANAALAP